MMVTRSFSNLVLMFMFAGGVWAMSSLMSCGGDSPTGGGGGGGGTKELSSGNISGSGGTYTHVFNTAKTIPYHCAIHGQSMSGVITVNVGGTPSRTNINITSSSFPSSTIIDVMDTIVWTNNSGMTHTVTSDN